MIFRRLPLPSLPWLAPAGPGLDAAPNATEWLRAAAQDLRANPGAGIVIAGETQPPEVHAIVAQINQSLGNVGATVRHCVPVEANPVNQLQSLQSLIDDMQRAAVDLLVILGGNPVYDAPTDLGFGQALQKVKFSVHHSLQANETSARCRWHVPATHFLESWSDIRAFDGTATIVQPLVEPLYDGISVHQLLDAFIRQPVRSAYELVKATWQKDTPGQTFESKWRDLLSSGVTPGIGRELTPAPGSAPISVSQPFAAVAAGNLEIIFRPDPCILDGTYANNGWLQELPKPFSKVTWDNTALISPTLARRERLANGDYVELTFHGRKLDVPVWITPGQAENTVTLHLGYGRQRSGRIGTNKGYNAYSLRTSDSLWQGSGLAMRKLGRRVALATTQSHFNIEGREMYRAGTLAEFLQRPHFAPEMAEVPQARRDALSPG